jgi:type II secretory ATPase GspE/PulE/Tfp pilus assembly ATPase PilB-like protein
MRGLLLLLAVIVVVFAAPAEPLLAQEGASSGQHVIAEGWDGPGLYFSLLKIGAAYILFLMWVYTTDWVSTDCQELKLQYRRWNPMVFGTFLGAFILVWFLPWFAASCPLLVIAYVAPLASYVVYRNKQVHTSERVLTPSHIKVWLAGRMALFGVTVDTEEKDPHETGPPVILTARGGATDRDDNVNLLSARQAPGFRDARQLLADALYSRGDSIMLDFTQQAASVRHMIDGVWHADESIEREIADPMLEALKTLCGLDASDRQKRQEGTFCADYQSVKLDATFASQGTKTGERVIIKLEGEKTQFEALDDIGMRPKMQEKLREILGEKQGLVLFSAMPASGLRSTVNVALRDCDRFTSEFMAVEDEADRYEPVENVMVMTYNSAEGEKQIEVLSKFFLQEPNVAVIRDLDSEETVTMVCDEVFNERILISTIRAKDTAEALVKVLALGVPPAKLAKSSMAVFNQRLIRKLCEECKVQYAPTPKVLKQLGIPEGRVQAFHRPPQETEIEEICLECGGIGYCGRTAIFELAMIDDSVRKVLASSPNAETLRQALRKAGLQSLQQEGIVLVAKGVTSLPELMRVLKQ